MFIMETMERKQPRRRRSFTPEFKAEIVERCRAGDRTIGSGCIGPTSASIHFWG
jgi:transposase